MEGKRKKLNRENGKGKFNMVYRPPGIIVKNENNSSPSPEQDIKLNIDQPQIPELAACSVDSIKEVFEGISINRTQYYRLVKVREELERLTLMGIPVWALEHKYHYINTIIVKVLIRLKHGIMTVPDKPKRQREV